MIVLNRSMFGFVHQIFDTLEILVLTILLGSTQITLHDMLHRGVLWKCLTCKNYPLEENGLKI